MRTFEVVPGFPTFFANPGPARAPVGFLIGGIVKGCPRRPQIFKKVAPVALTFFLEILGPVEIYKCQFFKKVRIHVSIKNFINIRDPGDNFTILLPHSNFYFCLDNLTSASPASSTYAGGTNFYEILEIWFQIFCRLENCHLILPHAITPPNL